MAVLAKSRPRTSNANKDTEKKKGTRFSSSPLNLVRLAGIEPTTPWFVAKYSIQLSYSREKQNYSIAIFRLSSLFVQISTWEPTSITRLVGTW